MFVISNGKNYIGTDDKRRPAPVRSFHISLMFDEEEKAYNYLLNLPKELRNIGYSVVEVVKEEEREEIPDAITLKEIKDAVSQIETVFGKLFKQKDYIEKKVREEDAATLDLMHYAEFNSLDVVKGYKFYKQLKEIREKRREYKDILRIMNLVLHCSLSDISNGILSRELNDMDNREYNPRILEGLFE